jgi:hypothetical protein
MRNKKIIGVFFIVVGFLILITPFTPGSVLLLVGLNMVFGDSLPWLNKINVKLEYFWLKFLKYVGIKS